uniref:Uncharacterized protein n=1 Tax=Plectus sambesii TaxID=2011161 RepID=A0A914X9D0_9BILA
MFIVGVLDVCTLLVNAVVPSIYMFIPLSIDCHPVAIQILACWTCQLFWNAYCFMAVVLIMNRCVFMASPSNWHERLFENGRVWVWAAAALAYGCMFIAVFASPYGTLQFHSGAGIYIWASTDVIGSRFSTFNNTATGFLIPIGYILLALIIRRKRMDATGSAAQTTTAEKRLQLQAILICAPTCIAALFYYCAPQITSEVVVYQVIHVVWISSNGVSGLIYLALNKTIRNKVLRLIGMRKLVKGAISARVLPHAGLPSSGGGI